MEQQDFSSHGSDDKKDSNDTDSDIVIQPDGTILLRAERSAKGPGRIYTLTYSAQDQAGNTVVKRATVSVPRNKGNDK